MLDTDHTDAIGEALEKLRVAIDARTAPKPTRLPTLHQHSPERELALTCVLAALRVPARMRLSDAECRQNQLARDFMLREIQAERRLAEGPRQRSGDAA